MNPDEPFIGIRHRQRRPIMPKILKYTLRALLGLITMTVLWVLVYRFAPIPGTPLMLIRKMSDGTPINKCWTPLEEISPDMIVAVVAAEDAHFIEHNGFDWEQIEKAYADSEKGKRLRGASTISQQTAKNVFLWPGRSWLRKGLETYFTALIELLWSKERIMEVYLNCIETGEGLYGVAAVAETNFKKTPDNLTKKECALIAATLPNPRNFSSKKPSKYIIKRQNAILKEMNFIRNSNLNPLQESQPKKSPSKH